MAAPNISTGTRAASHSAGAILIAASLVDAAFVDLEPGASVASHLLWALTMLALLRSTAAAIRRLARGVRLPGGVLAPLTRAEHAAGRGVTPLQAAARAARELLAHGGRDLGAEQLDRAQHLGRAAACRR